MRLHDAFEWDPKKASANRKNHGITFAFAAGVFLNPRPILLVYRPVGIGISTNDMEASQDRNSVSVMGTLFANQSVLVPVSQCARSGVRVPVEFSLVQNAVDRVFNQEALGNGLVVATETVHVLRACMEKAKTESSWTWPRFFAYTVEDQDLARQCPSAMPDTYGISALLRELEQATDRRGAMDAAANNIAAHLRDHRLLTSAADIERIRSSVFTALEKLTPLPAIDR